MAASTILDDPLRINLRRQTKILLNQLGDNCAHAGTLRSVSTRSELLHVLSHLLSTSGLTMLVATAFRPILLDLCARFLEEQDNWIGKFEALCLLIGVHSELFPVLSSLLRWPQFAQGPLTSIKDGDVTTFSTTDLQRILLGYYRVLQANRDLPRSLGWSLAPLSRIIWKPHPSSAVCLLAIQCYALQAGMVEAERIKLEKEVVGDLATVDCPIEYGASVDSSAQILNGWLLHMTEAERLLQARNGLVGPQKYYSFEDGESSDPINPAEFSPLVVNVHGVLMLRSSDMTQPESPLISTPTTAEALRTLALHLSMGVPTLLTSSPSAGKSLLLSHLAATLYPSTLNQVVTIHLADTSLDPRSLLGSYVSSSKRPGTFDWKEGVLVRAMREGRWVVFEDIDRASGEVLGMIKPLTETLGEDKWVGGRAFMEVPGRGRIEAEENFKIFATRSLALSRNGGFPSPTFYGAHIFHEVIVPSPTHQDLRMIIDTRYPRLAGAAAEGLISLWEAVRALGSTSSTRDVGLHELEKLCMRVARLLPSSHAPALASSAFSNLTATFPNPALREGIFLEARDVFFGAGATNATARSYFHSVASTVAERLGLSPERRDWAMQGHTPEYALEKDVNGSITAVRLGRTRLFATQSPHFDTSANRPFAMHKLAISLLSRIAAAVSLDEPVLLTGETGTGKTSVISHLASLLRKPLISLNLSNQTESSDIVGGFKPIDARVPASQLHQRFLDLFGGTFSRKRNAHFEESVRKAVQEGKWKRAVALWLEACKLARERISAKTSGDIIPTSEGEKPRKRRKIDQGLNVPEDHWVNFEHDVRTFEVQHVHGNGKFAFGFVEGPLVKALRTGCWILLDEVNLASPETLECVSSLLHGPTASITLTEQGSLEPIPRHPEFRLFACMNPATDVGKKDLPPNIRSRFTEIDVPPPDADKETLLSIISQYIGHCAVGDMGAVMDVAEFYTSVRVLAERRELADGSNHRPHFSMRTLARALTFAADLASAYSLRRSLWEGCLMAFTMSLDDSGSKIVTSLAQKYILAGVRNPKSLLSKEPTLPPSRRTDEFLKFGPFYLERGPLPEDPAEEYIITPSVEKKLVDLARILVTRRFPVLIEGPTSSGKTSSIEYIAKRTGHRFVRINNHEHTDIQEYLGTYVSDPVTGKLVFKDGLLVRALRQGDWIVLDELNLAPTDVLEALNRLLDDNRELIIPETQEIVRPHPHFMLFATQNPPGLYAGRKILSRAFRNRFLEVHFEDVPQMELETILCQRCRIAPSYGQRIVAVFRELQKRRQTSRIFESKHGFATLRDLFRWAGRDASTYQELADNGYMLLAERARRNEDKEVVKNIIESIMKVRIDSTRLYSLHQAGADLVSYLGCPIPQSSWLVWTSAMQRLFILVARALRFNEPVLLVGETGCGKTSVCQLYAEVVSKALYSVNCHQNTETADLIGGMRPVRNRASRKSTVLREACDVLDSLGHHPLGSSGDAEAVISLIDQVLKTDLLDTVRDSLLEIRGQLRRSFAMFEWHDGPLVEAMRRGDAFLMDEISLADDSVLERLNSVLESSRTIVLAERGGDDHDLLAVRAVDGFKLVATMNPGGDYGKQELSPALRNRFTEIWVPTVDSRDDLELIVGSMWRHEVLKSQTSPLLDFTEWLGATVSDPTLVGLRDILAWVEFSNAVCSTDHSDVLPLPAIFHHAARMTLLDGLGSLPQLSSYSSGALATLRIDASAKLQELMPLPTSNSDEVSVHNPATHVQLGSFSIPRGPTPTNPSLFSFEAPTTRDNVMRVVRACQLPKPILLEGSPGVGKTSLVSALANVCGYELCRINLSDQTDLVDLFGSDLPVEGGAPGEFAWKDAEFLRALQEGHWVLLDEMNLAPQAVLEGLNAVLDHRGTVYIPELGRSFVRHPSFRIFAAQNPLHQGGGRKGLPKSFLNRFTKVYVQELSSQDVLLVCRNLFPTIPVDILHRMIDYTARLNDEVMVKRFFGREGAPWEFNLRDVIRWGSLLEKNRPATDPSIFLNTLFLQRFRVLEDRRMADLLFRSVFGVHDRLVEESPALTVAPSFVQIGYAIIPRYGCTIGRRPGPILQAQSSALESIAVCVTNGWLTILTGPHRSGKSSLVRLLSHLTGQTLCEIPVNNATDASDILGSFEEIDIRGQALQYMEKLDRLLCKFAASKSGSHITVVHVLSAAVGGALKDWSEASYGSIREGSSKLLDILRRVELDDSSLQRDLIDALQTLLHASHDSGRFEWVDGPLVKALRQGFWVCLDGANLCNPSVLDRLNSLCEKDGILALNERGAVNGDVEVVKPHPNFRLFMCVDSHYGELSRAMRNRGVEIALTPGIRSEDKKRLFNYLRLPVVCASPESSEDRFCLTLETVRRGMHTFGNMSEKSTGWPSHLLVNEDSSSSSLMHMAVSLKGGRNEEVTGHFVSSVVAPNHLPLLIHYVRAQSHELHRALSFVFSMMQSHTLTVAREFRGELSRATSAPSELLLAQPMDLQMSIPQQALNGNLKKQFTFIALLLRLFVTLSTSARTVLGNAVERSQIPVHEDIFSAIEGLVKAIQLTTDQICDHIVITDDEVLESLTLSLRLVSCAKYLKLTASQPVLDYSAVHVMARLLRGYCSEKRMLSSKIEAHVKGLWDLVSPKTGLGMSEIWQHLSPGFSRDLKEVNELQKVADTLPWGKRSLRTQIFQLISLLTLPTINEATEENSRLLIRRLDDQLLNEPTQTWAAERSNEDSLLLLHQLQLLCELQGPSILSTAQEIIAIACFTPGNSLSRLVSYQHLIWEVETKQPMYSTVAEMQRLWLAALWKLPPQAECEGPSVLLMPIALYGTLTDCDFANEILSSVDAYEDSLHRRLRSIMAISSHREDRLTELTKLNLQCLLLIISCFREFYNAEDYAEIEVLSLMAQEDSLLKLLVHLERSNHPGLSAAIQQHVKPFILRLRISGLTGQNFQVNVGELWIAFFRVMMDLFVPDIPVDPILLQRRAGEYQYTEAKTLQDQISMHQELELRTSGNNTNGTIRFLEAYMADTYAKNVPVLLQRSRRDDLNRLHTYWSEIHEFLNRAVSVTRIQAIVTTAKSGDPTVSQLEHVVQESISAFCQRLEGIYDDYRDLNSPIVTALLALKLGLRLIVDVACRGSSGHRTDLVGILLAFPSVCSAEGLRLTPLPEESDASLDLLVTKLAGVDSETVLLGGAQPFIEYIDQIYEQAVGLWLIDRARAEEKDREAQTLYRRKEGDDELDEAAGEEEEFLALFPEFEDVLNEASPSGDRQASQKTEIVQASAVVRFSEIHQALFLPRGVSTTVTFARFMDCRRVFVGGLLESSATFWPEQYDRQSVPFQARLLHDKLTDIEGGMKTVQSYDFYRDGNIPEAKKAVAVLKALSDRLNCLISQWPDQMVLQHLKGRCDIIIKFPLRSPVAKILSALEQLLTNLEDWEMYANRDNTLKNYKQSIIELIVAWRRMELSAWRGLLNSQAAAFSQASSEWWFRLYNAAVRAVVSAFQGNQENEADVDNVDTFLDELVPLLDDFMTCAPIGQFSARLHLLHSMENFVDCLIKSKSSEIAIPLRRVWHVLYFTRIHYTQFEPNVSKSLGDQRTALEKELQIFIKLASWKDVNVHALRQSAQKTHRQLYKIVRKFRDVLRQPVTPLLQPAVIVRSLPNETSGTDAILAHISPSEGHMDFPSPPSHLDCPQHLSNLPRTFRNYISMVDGQIIVCLQSHLPQSVESFSQDIISTSKALAAVAIPNNVDSIRKTKLLKNLLSRKRKAWSDLLKELKRAGFPANLKPEVLDQNCSARWVREQPSVIADGATSTIIDRAEDYFHRVTTMLPPLRASLSDHSSDLPTRDLQRALMHVESSFALAMRSRSCLSHTAKDLRELFGLQRRLGELASDGHIIGSGPTVLPYLSFARSVSTGLKSALQELSELLVHLQNDDPTTKVPPIMLEEISTNITSLDGITESLSKITHSVSSSMLPILLDGEHGIVETAYEHLKKAQETLQGWSVQFPHLAAFVHPVQVWLQEKKAPPLKRSAPTESAGIREQVIDAVLLSVQAMLKTCSPVDVAAGGDERNNYIRDDCQLVCALSEKLNVERVLHDLQDFISNVPSVPIEDTRTYISRLSPFLDRYADLVQTQVTAQSGWTKSLFKFSYVLCSIVTSVAKDGFCQPKEGEEAEAAGQGEEVGEGAGLGEGTGTENVSKEIQEESQVEGLQGEDSPEDDQVERAEEGNAIEMSEDFGGELQDVPEDEKDEEEDDEEDEGEPDEQLGEVEGSDENAVDEKLWGDEQGPDEQGDGGKTDADHSKQDTGKSETVAKEGEQAKKDDKCCQEDQPVEDQDQPADKDENTEVENEEAPGIDGAPLDDFTQEAETLDLPENMELDGPEKHEEMGDIEDEDEVMDEQFDGEEGAPEAGSPDGPPDEDDAMDVEDAGMQQVDPEAQGLEEDKVEGAVAQPDTHPGDGAANEDTSAGDASAQDTSREDRAEGGQSEQRAGESGRAPGEAPQAREEEPSQLAEKDESVEEMQAESANTQPSSEGGSGVQKSSSRALPQEPRPLSVNPLRSLGDALREISQRFNEILEGQDGNHENQDMMPETDKQAAAQLEYIREDDTQAEMQALGPAGEDHEAKLRDLKMIDENEPLSEHVGPIEEEQMDVDPAESDAQKSSLPHEEKSEALHNGVESALTPTDIRARASGASTHDLDAVVPELPSSGREEDAEHEVELALQKWQAQGQPSDQAERMWRRYESLTHDLSYALCEQLRLILEPTMATRLKGDYRTGKRLNMKKIIPYIASEYTKDKIWLRRTRPSQREYQVLIALDDSKSMAESHSVHLAFQTLALVSKALSRLEVGDVAIAKFGKSVEILHGFEGGPFTDQSGTRVMDAFKFNQQATQVQALLETSLTLLEQARERRAMSSSSAADLWQMEIIISDGISQDHEQLRSILRKAEEQRVMVVFIILDSLHANTSVAPSQVAGQNSILSMNQVAYKEVDGRMDLTVTRYLDTFPFEYYVVVRNVEALPEVLAGTLKQFFERISEE